MLGSTGSIGTQTLDIIAEHPDKFRLVALAAGSNVELLAQQVRQFRPSLVAIRDASKVSQLKELIKDVHPQPEIMVGDAGAVEVRPRDGVRAAACACVLLRARVYAAATPSPAHAHNTHRAQQQQTHTHPPPTKKRSRATPRLRPS